MPKRYVDAEGNAHNYDSPLLIETLHSANDKSFCIFYSK